MNDHVVVAAEVTICYYLLYTEEDAKGE